MNIVELRSFRIKFLWSKMCDNVHFVVFDDQKTLGHRDAVEKQENKDLPGAKEG